MRASLVAVSKESAYSAETRVLSWGWKIPWRRKWQPLQNSCLENPMDRGAWQDSLQGRKESDMTEATYQFSSVVSDYLRPYALQQRQVSLFITNSQS